MKIKKRNIFWASFSIIVIAFIAVAIDHTKYGVVTSTQWWWTVAVIPFALVCAYTLYRKKSYY